AVTWPQISVVAEDHKDRIVGYVLAKMYAAYLHLFLLPSTVHGHIKSISVLHSYRHLGLARRLMLLVFHSLFISIPVYRRILQAEEAMVPVYKVFFISLHVWLHHDALGFRVAKVEENY
ncbi:hypothetical protein B0H15DRAFT_751302, partial [Mycena belliarum]